jgi:peptide-methionine (S)-S-oxide reductase
MKRISPDAIFGVALVAILGLGAWALVGSRVAAEAPRTLPAPVMDEPPGAASSETIVVAGGCFWGIQAVYQHLEGVTSAVSGYAGGDKKTAVYEKVGSGGTGHAESVQVTFDPRKVSLGRILQVFFAVAHDPTQLNRQGPDYGPQYRSAIFPSTPGQAEIAKAYVAQLDQAHAFEKPIVTKIETDRSFYPAEAYHQDYLTRNPSHPYIVINDIPKIEALKRLFPERYRAVPVLVAGAR